METSNDSNGLAQARSWMVDLNDDAFKNKHAYIIKSISLYDDMLIQIVNKNMSNMSSLDICQDKLVNDYLTYEFKKDIQEVCRKNLQPWAFKNTQKNDPINFYVKAQQAYRYAALNFMPKIMGWQETKPKLLAKTVQY